MCMLELIFLKKWIFMDNRQTQIISDFFFKISKKNF